MDILYKKYPSVIFYSILEYAPCFQVSEQELKRNRFYKKTLVIIKNLKGLAPEHMTYILDKASSFDYCNETHFEIEHSSFFLSIFYRNKKFFQDYIIIYF